jgi:hypothetical protein
MILVSQTIIAALVAALLCGCITTPGPHIEPNSALFGTAPDCPIRVGETTRDAVVARFGAPTFSTQHFLACGYYFTTKIGTSTGLHAGPCIIYFGTTDACEDDDVWLEFDSRGVLKRCERHLIGPSWGDSEKAWRQFAKDVPDPIRLD